MERGKVRTEIYWGNLGQEDHLKDPGIDGRIILKLTLEKWDGACTSSILFRIGTGCCECGNEPLGSIKCGEYVD
jgi:hypothetical protein